jgi:hypothetical protein
MISYQLHFIISVILVIIDIIAIILLSTKLEPINEPLVNFGNGNTYRNIRLLLIYQIVTLIVLNLSMTSYIDNELINFISFIFNIFTLFISLSTVVLTAYAHDKEIKSEIIRQNSQYQATLTMILITGCVGTIITSAKCYH